MSDSLRRKIEQAINSESAENGSATPDFILAEYLTDCLAAFDKAVIARGKWYGRSAEAFEREARYEHVTDTAEDYRAAAEERGDD